MTARSWSAVATVSGVGAVLTSGYVAGRITTLNLLDIVGMLGIIAACFGLAGLFTTLTD